MSSTHRFEAGHVGRRAVRFALARFPALLDEVPLTMCSFAHGFGRGNGCCTHPELLAPEWLLSRGGRLFFEARDRLPDGFCAVGTRNAGGSEYLFAMWKSADRLFSFHAQYVNFQVGDHYEEVGATLGSCLAAWHQGAAHVIWSCGRFLPVVTGRGTI